MKLWLQWVSGRHRTAWRNRGSATLQDTSLRMQGSITQDTSAAISCNNNSTKQPLWLILCINVCWLLHANLLSLPSTKKVSPGCFEGAACSTVYCHAEEVWGLRESGTCCGKMAVLSFWVMLKNQLFCIPPAQYRVLGLLSALNSKASKGLSDEVWVLWV